MKRAIQLTVDFSERAEAHIELAGLKTQEGCLGGRVVLTTHDYYQMQAFFKDDDRTCIQDDQMPDGCRNVMIPDRIALAMGLKS